MGGPSGRTPRVGDNRGRIDPRALRVVWGISGLVSLLSQGFHGGVVVKGVLFRLSYFFCPGVRDAHRRRVRGPSHCD